MTISRTFYHQFKDSHGSFDVAAFVEGVVFFDRLLLGDPTALTGLCQSCGLPGVLSLLSEGRLAIVGGGPNAQAKYDYLRPGFFRNRPLDRPLRYGFETIYVDPNQPRNPTVEERLLKEVTSVGDACGFDGEQRAELAKALMDTMVPLDVSSLKVSDDLRHDIRSKPAFLADLLTDALVDNWGVAWDDGENYIAVEEVYDEVFQINTDVGQALNVSDEELHRVLGARFFEITGAHLQLHRMRAVGAIAGLSEAHASITERRADFLSNLHSEGDLRKKATRIIDIADVPVLEPGTAIDVNALLALSESSEAGAFRDWIQVSNLEDAEIKELMSGWRAKVGELLKRKSGKRVSWLASTGAGLAAPAAGIVLGVVDQFLGDLLPGMGPIGFIPSVYKPYVRAQQKKT